MGAQQQGDHTEVLAAELWRRTPRLRRRFVDASTTAKWLRTVAGLPTAKRGEGDDAKAGKDDNRG